MGGEEEDAEGGASFDDEEEVKGIGVVVFGENSREMLVVNVGRVLGFAGGGEWV